MAKSLQRKKPGYTKDGSIKIVSLNTVQLVDLLDKTQKKKVRAQIKRRLVNLGYQAPAVVEEVVE
jgi:hypothetical protein